MPDCVRANTNATIMMIGERVGEFVKDWIPAFAGKTMCECDL